jgi:hypothetical protein
MASVTIPEEIVGIPLFVPSSNNFFSVESGGLPNGEDCLKVLGGTSRDYKAFQNAETLVPDVFRSVLSRWSMTFWYKASNITGASTDGINQFLMGVMNNLYAPSISAPSVAAFAGNANVIWAITASPGNSVSGNRIQFSMWLTSSFGPTVHYGIFLDTPLTAGSWNLITITVECLAVGGSTYGLGGNLYIDDSPTAAASHGNANGVGYPGLPSRFGTSPPISPVLYFSLGSYSDGGAANGRDGDWYLGKLAFHDHILNATERASLFLAMTT